MPTGLRVWRPLQFVTYDDFEGYFHEMLSPSEEKIAGLCSKLSATDDSSDCEPLVRELREAIHEHLMGLRNNVADLAVRLGSSRKSKAA
jgi:hypothetical protein